MDLSTIKPLNDFPDTPYKKMETSVNLRFRWIHGQCFQFEFPNKKVLLTDPFFPQHPKAWKQENTPVLDLDDLGTVDYVTINHSHFDHVASISDVFKKNRPIVICDRIFARELSAAYHILEYNIYPIVPGMTYQFPDFQLDTIIGKHGSLGTYNDPEGKIFADPEEPMIGPLNSYGCLFNTNFMFTLKNNFRICFAAGVDLDPMIQQWQYSGTDLLLRQRMRKEIPKDFAQECEALGGHLVLPMHHDACDDTNQDMNQYAEEVNRIFKSNKSGMRMFNPQRLKWYTIQMTIAEEA